MMFGKLAAKHDPRTLKLGALLTPDLPAAPASFNALPRVESATKVKDPTRLFPLDHNDSKGDCVVCAVAHAQTIFNAYCKKKRIAGADKVLSTYFQLTGGADNGLVELDTLNHWRNQGLLGEKILAYAAVDWKNHDMVRRAISLFGGVMIGFRVQVGAVERFDRRELWVPDTLTNEGHAVWLYAYDANTVSALTWGSTQRGSWSWLNQTCDEMYAILPGEATLASFEPGLDLAALKSALAAITA